jgi:muramoyltetrapeptide carboxypeptidase
VASVLSTGVRFRRLRLGDRVRLVSPASRPDEASVEQGAELLRSWGLTVEIGQHAFDSWGHYLAGRDVDRAADLNDALRDPGVRAVSDDRRQGGVPDR